MILLLITSGIPTLPTASCILFHPKIFHLVIMESIDDPKQILEKVNGAIEPPNRVRLILPHHNHLNGVRIPQPVYADRCIQIIRVFVERFNSRPHIEMPYKRPYIDVIHDHHVRLELLGRRTEYVVHQRSKPHACQIVGHHGGESGRLGGLFQHIQYSTIGSDIHHVHDGRIGIGVPFDGGIETGKITHIERRGSPQNTSQHVPHVDTVQHQQLLVVEFARESVHILSGLYVELSVVENGGQCWCMHGTGARLIYSGTCDDGRTHALFGVRNDLLPQSTGDFERCGVVPEHEIDLCLVRFETSGQHDVCPLIHQFSSLRQEEGRHLIFPEITSEKSIILE